MGNAFVRCVQGALGVLHIQNGVNTVQALQQRLNDDYVQENCVPERVEQWVRNEMREFGISDYEKIPISQYLPCSCCSGAGWIVENDKKFLVHASLAAGLNVALGEDENLYLNDGWGRCIYRKHWDEVSDEESIAVNKILLRSALKEYQYQPTKSSTIFPLALSYATLTLSALLTHVKPPKSVFGVVEHMLLSGMSIFPLDFTNDVKRLIRKRAECFACKNAETRFELEALQKYVNVQDSEIEAFERMSFMQKYKKRMSNHGYFGYAQLHPIDRAIMVKKYLKLWDEEHKS